VHTHLGIDIAILLLEWHKPLVISTL